MGSDAFEAQRQRNARLDADESQRLRGTAPAPSPTMQPTFDRLTLSAAAEKYFSNCEKRGLDSKTIRKHRAAVEPFIQHCGVIYVDECRENKQPLFDMGWLRGAARADAQARQPRAHHPPYFVFDSEIVPWVNIAATASRHFGVFLRNATTASCSLENSCIRPQDSPTGARCGRTASLPLCPASKHAGPSRSANVEAIGFLWRVLLPKSTMGWVL